MAGEAKSEKKGAKFLKSGKIVLILNGRMAGKKAVIVKSIDDGTADRPYGHAIVAGVQKAPLKITKAMSEAKIKKRSRVKPFVKCINYNHFMPTRYSLELDLKSLVTTDIVSSRNPTARANCRKELKKLMEDKYNASLKPNAKGKWFFQKLRF